MGKIFIINNMPFHHLLEKILKDNHYKTASFDCAGDIFQCIQDQNELPDLVITPLVIPIGDINGAELALMLKSSVPFIPIMMITNLDSFLNKIPVDIFQEPFEINPRDTQKFLRKIEYLMQPRSVLCG